MGYFDACEACGDNSSLVLDGLCAECNRKATRAAYGSSTLPRQSGLVYEDGRIMVLANTGSRSQHNRDLLDEEESDGSD